MDCPAQGWQGPQLTTSYEQPALRNPARPLEMMDKLENTALATMAGKKVGQHHTTEYYFKTLPSTKYNRQTIMELKSINFSIKVGSN